MTVPADNYTSTLFESPGMKKLFKTKVVTNTGYYGKLNFFYTQLDFDQIFGNQPKIYHDFEKDKDSRDVKR